MLASSDVLCHFLEHFFSALSCFGSGAVRDSLPPGRSASASVPELSSSRHAAWLNLADFRSSGDLYCVSHPVIHNSLWLSCLAFWKYWEKIRVINPFDRWFPWGRTIVCPDAFVLRKISSRSMFWWCMMTDIDIWKHPWVAIYVSVKSNLQIRWNKNLSKTEFFWSFSLKNNDYE